MRKLVFVFLAILLLCPVLAFGQAPTPPPPQPGAAPRGPMPPPELGKWWKNSEVVEQLKLTDAQIKQIEDTFLEHRLKLIDLHAEVERQEARLQPLIEADQPDEAKVSAQIDLVIAARGKLEKANTMMMLAIRKVLTVEQWKKLQAIQQERQRMRFHGARGPEEPRTPRPPQAPTPEAND
ncbi:MAG: Spy/CpxP family protein refolding chaperone [Terriglobales bacterium]